MRQTGSVYRAMALYPPPLGWAAAVVRDGRDVGDGSHLQACGLQGADRLLTAGAGALDEDLDVAHAVLHGALGGAFRGLRGGVGRALPRALEAHESRRTPAQHVAGRVGDRHDRVVERGLDVGVPYRDVLSFALLGASRALPLSHGTPVCSDLFSDRTDVAQFGFGLTSCDGCPRCGAVRGAVGRSSWCAVPAPGGCADVSRPGRSR